MQVAFTSTGGSAEQGVRNSVTRALLHPEGCSPRFRTSSERRSTSTLPSMARPSNPCEDKARVPSPHPR